MTSSTYLPGRGSQWAMETPRGLPGSMQAPNLITRLQMQHPLTSRRISFAPGTHFEKRLRSRVSERSTNSTLNLRPLREGDKSPLAKIRVPPATVPTLRYACASTVPQEDGSCDQDGLLSPTHVPHWFRRGQTQLVMDLESRQPAPGPASASVLPGKSAPAQKTSRLREAESAREEQSLSDSLEDLPDAFDLVNNSMASASLVRPDLSLGSARQGQGSATARTLSSRSGLSSPSVRHPLRTPVFRGFPNFPTPPGTVTLDSPVPVVPPIKSEKTEILEEEWLSYIDQHRSSNPHRRSVRFTDGVTIVTARDPVSVMTSRESVGERFHDVRPFLTRRPGEERSRSMVRESSFRLFRPLPLHRR